MYSGPVNWRGPDGAWRRIDTGIVAKAGTADFTNGSGPLSVTFSGRPGGDSWVRVGAEDWSVGFAPVAPNGRVPSDARVRAPRGPAIGFDGAFPGTRLDYRMTPAGVKEHIVLPARVPDSTGRYRFILNLTGVTARAEDDGGIGFYRGDARVALLPPGSAWDSARLPGDRPAATAVTATLAQEGGTTYIDVAVAAEWLADPARVYPVTIDPHLVVGLETTAWDAFVSSGCDICNYNGDPGPFYHQAGQRQPDGYYANKVGRDGTNEFYSYLEYDFSRLQGKNIVGATWDAAVDYASPAPNRYSLYPVAAPWDDELVSWSSKPNHRAEVVNGEVTAAPGRVQRDITSWVVNWATGAWPNYGLSLDTGGLNHYFEFDAAEDDGFNHFIHVDWTEPGVTPTATSPADQAVVRSEPRLQATFPPGVTQPSRWWFYVGTGEDGSSGQVVSSGWVTSSSWQIPPETLIDGVTYYWKVVADNGTQSSSVPRSFKLNRRLGAQAASPFDGLGPVQVNLSSGNALVTAASPTSKTVGGDVGLTYTYNSAAPEPNGLLGRYRNQANDPWQLSRRDPQVNFRWGLSSPAPGLTEDAFEAEWTGYVTVPSTGDWTFGAVADDFASIRIGNQEVLPLTTTSSDPVRWGAVSTELASKRTVPITVRFKENGGEATMELHARGPGVTDVIVPTSWLTQGDPALPKGWSLSVDVDTELAYASAKNIDGRIVLTEPSGVTHEYLYRDGAFRSPADDEAVVTLKWEGIFVDGADGIHYRFDHSGNLVSAVSSMDDTNTASPRRTWDSRGRLVTITDPQSARTMNLDYGGNANCPAPPSGFEAPPDGMLCRVRYFDNTETRLFYANRRLARIEDPGAEITDFGYDSAGRLIRLRDPLAADFVAAGLRANDDTTRTLITYNLSGQVSSVRLPVADAGSTIRPQHNYTYTLNTVDSGGAAEVDIAGLPQPNGYNRRVQTNAAGQTITDTDTTGLTTRSEWDNGDRLLWSTDTAGLRTSTVYDPYRHWPTDTYGPAPESCFTGQTPNGTCTVPRTSTAYDEGMTGLASAYFPNMNLVSQEGMYHGTLNNGLDRQWGTNSPVPGTIPADGFSARFSGDLRFPQAGTYNLRVYADDGFRLFIDDKKVLEDWVDGAGSHSVSYTNAVAGARRKITVEFYENTGNAQLQLFWTPPGGSEILVPGAEMGPRYGLETSTVDADGKQSKTEYSSAAQGLASATIVDPLGLNLRSETTYETTSSGYRRPASRRLPKGVASQVRYEYWDGSGSTNPCDPGSTTFIHQAGQLWRVTEPDPDGTGPKPAITRQHFYDAAGRVLGIQVNNDSWACTTYDSRGRVGTQRDPAGGTTTYGYSTPGVITATFPDSLGATRTTRTDTDILGRVLRYTDEQGTATRTAYDVASRATATFRTFAGQTETQLTSSSFDGFGRLSGATDHLTGTARTVTFGYDGAGRLNTTSRPNGVVSTTGFNANTGRLDRISHTSGTQALAAWTAEHTLAGNVKNETTAGRTRAYTYDKADRLIGVNDAGTTRAYAYDANTNRCGTAANTCNTSWAYDNADRALSTPGASYGYDTRGNTTAITPTTGTATTFTYDATNRATVIDDPARRTEETLTPNGRVLVRKVTDKATNQVVEHLQYGYDGGSDSPAYQRPVGTGGAATTYLDGPGGLLAIQTGSTTTWPLANGHGDIIGTTDNNGAYTAKPVVDEFGKGTVTSDRLGWLGTHQRYTAATTSGIIRMGHRLYDPRIGRFLQVDPIEGGSANDYDYVSGDPINNFDLSGEFCTTGKNSNGTCRSISRGVRRNLKAVVRWPVNAAGRGVGALQGRSQRCGSGQKMRCVRNARFVPRGAGAWTLGNTVYCRRRCAGLVAHEAVHVRQYAQGGIAFPALYGWEAIFGGNKCGNKYERSAYNSSGPHSC